MPNDHSVRAMTTVIAAAACIVLTTAITQIDSVTQIKNKAALDPREYNWSRRPSGIIAPGANTIAVSCPQGLTANSSWAYLNGTTATVNVGSVVLGDPIVVNTATGHGLVSGNLVTISGGVPNWAQGAWNVTVTSSTQFTLLNSNALTSWGILEATNTSPIVVSVYGVPGVNTGDSVTISGVTGNTAANGTWTVTRLDEHRYALDGSTGNGAGLSSGSMAVRTIHPGGTVTFGPESVLITGGTCTGGASVGTITFSAANAQAAGYAVQSASEGLSEAVNMAASSGVNTVRLSGGTLKCRADTNVPSGIDIGGAGPQTIIQLDPGYPMVRCLVGAGTLSNVTTSATTLPFANRSTTVTDTINFTSTTGYSAGSWVQLYSGSQPISGNNFYQLGKILSITSSSVRFKDGIVVPLDPTAAGHSISLMAPLSRISIHDLTLDGGGIGYARYAHNQLEGIHIISTVNSSFRNLWFRGWTGSAAMMLRGGYGNVVDNISVENSGTGGYNDLSLHSQTALTASNITSMDAAGFGPGCYQCILSNVSNVTVMRPMARALKLAGTGWSNFTNLTLQGSVGGNGLAITQGSYRNHFTNVTAIDNKNTEGIWFSSQDNQYNILNNVTICGNYGSGLIIYTNDHHNSVNGFSNCGVVAGDIAPDLGTDNTINTAAQFRVFAYATTPQSIPNDVWTPLNFDTELYDVGGLHSTTSDTERFTVPSSESGHVKYPNKAGALYLMTCNVSFAASATGSRSLRVYRFNGFSTGQVGVTTLPSTGTGGSAANLALAVPVLSYPGESFRCEVYQDSGGALNASGGVTEVSGSLTRLH
jgi:hypothetical protein